MRALGITSRQDQLAALSSAHRLALLRRMMCGPATISGLGRDFGRHPAWIRHHLKQLEAVGLIQSAGERTTRNYTEKFYRATDGALAIHLLVAPDSGSRRMTVALGSDDFALQLLADELNAKSVYFEIAASSVGSLDGLVALRQGLADMAGCHLLDPETDEYNTPYLRHLFPDRAVDVITLAHREQGLAHARGARRPVRDLVDLADSGVRFANRNAGSGTRVWLDSRLRELGISHGRILGYDHELRTHDEVAAAVQSGVADVGLVIRAAAEKAGLEFTSLFTERYDLVIDAARAEEESLARIWDHLDSPRFRLRVGKLWGYDSGHTGEGERLAV
jgi:putative molybdopterin biosynthesis protein